jgi:hypothetical protein
MSAIYRDLVASSAASVEGYSDAELLLIREFLQRGREVTLAHVERVKALPNDPERPARPAEPHPPD